jgi:CBS-domain-containing membrane protein
MIEPSQATRRHALIAACGGALGIAIMVMLAEAAGVPLAAVPFTTSIVLVMAAPDSPQARPRNILGGHLLCALAGFLTLWLFGSAPLLCALAVGLGIGAMVLANVLHPPAGINGVLIVTLAPAWTYLFVPVLAGSLTLVAYAIAFRAALAWADGADAGSSATRDR